MDPEIREIFTETKHLLLADAMIFQVLTVGAQDL
jgi:hypothetical protein